MTQTGREKRVRAQRPARQADQVFDRRGAEQAEPEQRARVVAHFHGDDGIACDEARKIGLRFRGIGQYNGAGAPETDVVM